MEKSLPQKTPSALRGQLKPLVYGMGFGAVGAVIGILIAEYAKGSLPDVQLGTAGKVALVALAVAAFPLVVALHELGHLLGGIAVGFRPLLFMVGPLRIERSGEGFRTRVQWKGALFGGLAACVPADTRDLRRRMLVLIAGGPAINFVTGAVLLAGCLLAGPVGDLVLVVLGGMSLLIGLSALVPTGAGNFYSDGVRMVRLLRGGADVEREVAALGLIGMSSAGVRPRDWSPELVGRATAGDADTLFGVVGKTFGFQFHLDRGHPDAARPYLEAAVAGLHILPKQARPSILLQAAFFAARADGDPARARGYLADSEGGVLVPPYLRPLAEAAIARAEGDLAAARARLDAAEAGLATATDPGSAAAAAERIAGLRAELA